MLRDRLEFSERRACLLVGQHRSTQRHEPPAPSADDAELRARLREIAKLKPRWGYRRAHALLRQDGREINRKRVQRLSFPLPTACRGTPAAVGHPELLSSGLSASVPRRS